jgi:acetyl esterase
VQTDIKPRGTSLKGRRLPRLTANGAALTVLLFAGWATWAHPYQPSRPAPDIGNIRYGTHPRNVLDLWKAKPRPGRTATPLVIFFHGGGFRSGDKSSVPYWLITKCRSAGISVASANYRLSRMAPYPGPMRDGARAIQFLRSRAAEFGIDPTRIAASGCSAGAGIALWVGYHDDLADPESDDPVARQSSRLTCMGVDGAQTSYDPRFIKSLIGDRASEHPALPRFFGVMSAAGMDTPEVHRLFEDASPLNHVSADDPPSILFYVEPDRPLPPDAQPGDGIHHPWFGRVLKIKTDPLGLDCILRHEDEYPMFDDRNEDKFRDMVEFFVRQLSPGPQSVLK